VSDSINKQTNQTADLLSTPEKLQSVADLIANGEFPFPSGLSTEQRIQLGTEVSKRRYQRLVKYIARSIAQDIRQEIEQRSHKEKNYDSTAVRF
jgi:hypothetical protein